MYLLIAIFVVTACYLLYRNWIRPKGAGKYSRPFKTVRVYEEGTDPVLGRMEFYINVDDSTDEQNDK